MIQLKESLRIQTCPHCPKALAHKENLKTHNMTIHVKIKRFSCDFCTYEAGLKLNDPDVQNSDCKYIAFDKPENVGQLNDSIERKLKNSDLSTLSESFGLQRESENTQYDNSCEDKRIFL